jgi:glycosyltransferase involved in cell wall biosynthesis
VTEIISIIIPCYNEGRILEKTLCSLNRHLKKDDEIIVVCNGCTDDSIKIIKKLQKKNQQIKYINCKTKLGKGKAIYEGFQVASNNIIGYIDADNPFNNNTIFNSLKKYILNRDYDIILFSKWKNSSFMKVKEPFVKKLLSRIWNKLLKITLNINFLDTQGGAKFLKKDLWNTISKNHTLIASGYEFDAELIYLIKKYTNKIREIGISNYLSSKSKFRYFCIIPMFFSLIRVIYYHRIYRK